MSAELLAQDPVSGLRRRGSEWLYRVNAAVREAWGSEPQPDALSPRRVSSRTADALCRGPGLWSSSRARPSSEAGRPVVIHLPLQIVSATWPRGVTSPRWQALLGAA
jgi:hypothetical protein